MIDGFSIKFSPLSVVGLFCAGFVAACIRHILSLYSGSKVKPQSVAIVAHSMVRPCNYQCIILYMWKFHWTKFRQANRLIGSPSAVQRVEPQIRATVFQKIEKILGQTWFKIPSNQAAVLATTEFSQMETKLQND